MLMSSEAEMTELDRPAPPAFYSLRHVCSRIGLSEATLWRLRQAGKFPPPMNIYGRKIAWPADVVEGWIRQQIAEAEAA
jgi:predicted DNA-binding transcriptional regulator AlpA